MNRKQDLVVGERIGSLEICYKRLQQSAREYIHNCVKLWAPRSAQRFRPKILATCASSELKTSITQPIYT